MILGSAARGARAVADMRCWVTLFRGWLLAGRSVCAPGSARLPANDRIRGAGGGMTPERPVAAEDPRAGGTSGSGPPKVKFQLGFNRCAGGRRWWAGSRRPQGNSYWPTRITRAAAPARRQAPAAQGRLAGTDARAVALERRPLLDRAELRPQPTCEPR